MSKCLSSSLHLIDSKKNKSALQDQLPISNTILISVSFKHLPSLRTRNLEINVINKIVSKFQKDHLQYHIKTIDSDIQLLMERLKSSINHRSNYKNKDNLEKNTLKDWMVSSMPVLKDPSQIFPATTVRGKKWSWILQNIWIKA
jgi:hypothetical protein